MTQEATARKPGRQREFPCRGVPCWRLFRNKCQSQCNAVQNVMQVVTSQTQNLITLIRNGILSFPSSPKMSPMKLLVPACFLLTILLSPRALAQRYPATPNILRVTTISSLQGRTFVIDNAHILCLHFRPTSDKKRLHRWTH